MTAFWFLNKNGVHCKCEPHSAGSILRIGCHETVVIEMPINKLIQAIKDNDGDTQEWEEIHGYGP